MHSSGITVDDGLKSEFNSARSNASSLFVKVQIQNDSFKLTGRGDRQSSVTADYQEIQRHLSDREPCFILTRARSMNSSGDSPYEPVLWQILFYMPETALVRDRMIYASSTNALKDGLGSSSFLANVLSMCCRADCVESNLVVSSSHDDLQQILTLDEKLKIEAETSSAMAMSSVKVSAIVGLPIKCSEEATSAISELANGGVSAIIFSLHSEHETLLCESKGNFSFEDVSKKLNEKEPRYALINFAHEERENGSPLTVPIFLYYCPENIKPKLKMFYSTCKSMVIKLCESLNVTVGKSIEMSDIKDINTAYVLDDLYPQASVKKNFSKPAKPGRGKARLIQA